MQSIERRFGPVHRQHDSYPKLLGASRHDNRPSHFGMARSVHKKRAYTKAQQPPVSRKEKAGRISDLETCRLQKKCRGEELEASQHGERARYDQQDSDGLFVHGHLCRLGTVVEKCWSWQLGTEIGPHLVSHQEIGLVVQRKQQIAVCVGMRG